MLFYQNDKAEECAQNTFLKAYENLDKLLVHNNPAGWLYKTAHNYVMQTKDKIIKDNKLIEYDDNLKINCDDTLINQIDENLLLSDNEIEEYVKLILSQLKKTDYDLYNMFFVNKMPTKDIALAMNISPGSCRVRIFRLRKTIEGIVIKMFNT